MYLRNCLSLATLILAFSSGSGSVLMAQTPKEITNSIGMKLKLIPAGTFTMGSPIEEVGADDDEEEHQVTISKSYYLGAFEVTQGQYEEVMGVNPSHFQKRVIKKPDSSMYPVEQVSWNDAVKFCERLSDLPEEKKAGRVYRLPTEAEWEYACRAGSKTAFTFGNNPDRLGEYAWFKEFSDIQTHPVGEKRPNAWGIYDMHGNVWEWCSDWYGPYAKSPVVDPVGPRGDGILRGGTSRVLRGGGVKSLGGAAEYRSAERHMLFPHILNEDNGFRVALSSSGIPK